MPDPCPSCHADLGSRPAWCATCDLWTACVIHGWCYVDEALDLEMRMTEAEELTVKRLPSGYVHIRGRGPCNWAQGPSIQEAEPFVESGEDFRRALRKLQLDTESLIVSNHG